MSDAPRVEPPEHEGAELATLKPPPTLSLDAPSTQVWAVLGGRCRELSFDQRDASGGTLWVSDQQVRYKLRDGEIELRDITTLEGYGMTSRRCRTWLRLDEGPRLGGAPLFDDEPSCLADTGAAPLDDSPARVAAKCAGEQLPVDTEDIMCGREQRYSTLGKPGCLSLVAELLGWP